MPAFEHWSRFALPHLIAGALVAIGILVLVFSRTIVVRFACLGTVLGVILIVGGGLGLLLLNVKDPRFPK